MKRRFIINPASGGITEKAISQMKHYFERELGAFDYVMPQNRATAIQMTQIALREQCDQIIAIGGDGTVNAVANGFIEGDQLIRPEATLAVSQAGTGTDYYKSIVYPRKKTDWRQLVSKHRIESVDIGMIHYSDPQYCDQYFVNMASTGIIPEIVRKKEASSKNIPARFQYILPTLNTLFSYRPITVNIETDTGNQELKVIAIAISKGAYAGGGMRFGEFDALTSGVFHVTIFEAMSLRELAVRIDKILLGAYNRKIDKIQKLQTTRMAIRCETAVPIEFDGEVYGTTAVEMTIRPKMLRVCRP